MTGFDLETSAEIPWPPTAELGTGVAVPTGDLCATAVTPFEAEPGDVRSEHFTHKQIRTAAEAASKAAAVASTRQRRTSQAPATDARSPAHVACICA